MGIMGLMGIMAVALVTAGGLGGPAPLVAQQVRTPLVAINVRDFGAVGDGVTDDTDAFRAAAAALMTHKKALTPAGGSAEAMFPSVLFPRGNYLLTQTVNWGPWARLQADGAAIITSTAGTDAFWFDGGWMVECRGLTFIGGKTAITFRNNNVNGARLSLEHCRFQGTSEKAVWAGPQGGSFFSSHVTMRECKWWDCGQAIVSWADVTTLADSWIQWNEAIATANTAAIEIRGGRLNSSDTMFVPVFPTDNKGCAWLGFWSSPSRSGGSGIFCRTTLFHGEYGGLPVLRMHGVPDLAYPFQGPSVVFRDSQLSCGQTSRADTCCIQLHGGVPQTVVVDGSCNVVGPCPLIKDIVGNGADVLATIQNGPSRIRIQIGANGFYPLAPPVPDFLLPYVRNLAL